MSVVCMSRGEGGEKFRIRNVLMAMEPNPANLGQQESVNCVP